MNLLPLDEHALCADRLRVSGHLNHRTCKAALLSLSGQHSMTSKHDLLGTAWPSAEPG